MLDILSIGDAMSDMFVELSEAEVVTNKKKMQLNLCMSFADKIPAKSIDVQTAGNAANVAVGASRLGLKTAFYSVIGDDVAGRTITATMKKEKVSAKYLIVDTGKPNNYSIVLNYHAERTIIIYHEPRKYQLPKFSRARWVYFTSLGNSNGKNKSFEQLHHDVLEYVKNTGAKLAFNPGTFQLRMKKSLLKAVLAASDVVFLNVEEAKNILNVSPSTKVPALLKAVALLGARIVVITDGPNGAYCYDGKNCYHMPIFDAPIVERTGAGDSFATGFVCALFYNRDIHEALRWGSFNSAFVVGKVGPQAGLLYKHEMLQISTENAAFHGTQTC